jgi:hypothetical protein
MSNPRSRSSRTTAAEKDRRCRPHVTVADVVDDAPDGQVVISLFGLRGRRAAGVIVHYPQNLQRRHRDVHQFFCRVKRPGCGGCATSRAFREAAFADTTNRCGCATSRAFREVASADTTNRCPSAITTSTWPTRPTQEILDRLQTVGS